MLRPWIRQTLEVLTDGTELHPVTSPFVICAAEGPEFEVLKPLQKEEGNTFAGREFIFFQNFVLYVDIY